MMMSKRQERQRFIRYYKDKTGETEIDMTKVAALAKQMGWDMPKPKSDIELLANLFADDAQAERKYDEKTGKPYRVYQTLPTQAVGQLSLFVYVETDEATRPQMLRASVIRREQMVTDGYNLELDLDHWNRINPDKEPIQLPMDLTLDIAIRKASDDDDDDRPA
jgi:hypothetical protein